MPFRPFTDFLNQGMRNTNRNVGRMNMPRYQQGGFVNPYSQYSFGQGTGGGGGGGVMGHRPDWAGQEHGIGYEGHEGETAAEHGSSFGGGYTGGGGGGGEEEEDPGSKPWESFGWLPLIPKPPIDPRPPIITPPTPPISTVPRPRPQSPGYNNAIEGSPPRPPEYPSISPSAGPKPHDPLPTGWSWQLINGEWIPSQQGIESSQNPIVGGGGGEGTNYDLNNDGVVDQLDINTAVASGDYDDSFIQQLVAIITSGADEGASTVDIPPDYSGGDYFQEQPETSPQPHDELPQGYEWQFVNGEWLPVFTGGEVEDDEDTSDVSGGGGYAIDLDWGGLTDPSKFHSPSTFDFTGGGGRGGQAAKKLYYPGTSGGFASVGTGIGGGGSTLDELLKGLQG